MSLSKQLLLLVSALFLMIFSVNFMLSVENIRGYLEGESQVHAQDTATSLGLSLSPYMVDEKDPVIETMMNAIFDRGYYKEIKLLSVEGESLVTLSNANVTEEVPQWFINFLPMKAAVGESEISSGWSISGVVTVEINPAYAYFKLYEQVTTSFYYSLATLALSVALLLLVLRVTLSSLNRIGRMAETISKGDFETIERLPWTSDVRRVALSMNLMSEKLEKVIGKLNQRLEGLGKKLQLDDLTGLRKKNSFEDDMAELHASSSGAFVFIVKIDALGSLVKELGNNAIDQFIKDFAEILRNVGDDQVEGEVTSYRFFGSEFVLLARGINADEAELLAKALTEALSGLAGKLNKVDIAHIGVAEFDPFGSIDTILLAANEAYEQATLIGANGYYLRKGEDRAKDTAQWKELVFDIIDNNDYRISYVSPVKNLQTEKVIMVDAFSEAVDKNGDVLSIGTFVSIAEKFVKIVDLDKGVTTRVVEYINKENIQHSVAISLSNRTIKSSDFRTWLTMLLTENSAIAGKVVFSLSAYAVTKEVAAYKEFISFVHELNAKVIIKRFEGHLIPPDVVKQLRPDFIRLARDIGNGIDASVEKQEFMATVTELGDLLSIGVLAENINSEADLGRIKAIGVMGASR